MESAAFVDPFGAPEFLVDGVCYREMVGTDLIRMAFGAHERGERLIRVKLVIPASAMLLEYTALRRFLASTSVLPLTA